MSEMTERPESSRSPSRGPARRWPVAHIAMAVVAGLLAVLVLVQGVLVALGARGNDVPAEFELAGNGVPGIGEVVEVDGLEYTVTAARTMTVRLDGGVLGEHDGPVVVLQVQIENVARTSRSYTIDDWLLVDESARRYEPLGVVFLAHTWERDPLLPHSGSLNPGVVRTGAVVLEIGRNVGPDHLRIVESRPGRAGAPELGAVRLRD